VTSPQDAAPQDAPLGQSTDGQTQAFSVPGPLDVRVNLDYGLVRIAARTTTTASVQTRPAMATRQQDVEAAQNVRVSVVGDTFDVRSAASGWRRFVRPGAAEVTIEVPQGSRVTVTSGYADVEVAGSAGRCVVRSTGGSIRVEEATSAQLETKYGSVAVDRLADGGSAESTHGTVRVRQTGGTTLLSGSSGDVAVDRATGGTLTLRNTYGTLNVGELVTGTCSATNSYGSVDVGIPTGTAAYLDVRTEHGRVRSELGAAAEPGPTVERATVQARTSYGDITIRRA
jgi:DUF4097 and DUF4098 domain-containing protein YvlB